MTYNPFSLQGKTILVTGASSGIGRAIAVECSKMGACVIITGRNEKNLTETFNLLEKSEGREHGMILADLAKTEHLTKVISEIPPLDGLVNNAGIGNTCLIKFIQEEELGKVLHINLMVPVLLTQRLYKNKKLNKNASVVFVSSIAGLCQVTPGNAIYSASKSAVNAFMQHAALEFSQRGIRCNTVNPGTVNTPFLNKEMISAADRERDRARYPLKRYGEPVDVALGVIYLLSDASEWVTGSHLVIDGGCSLV